MRGRPDLGVVALALVAALGMRAFGANWGAPYQLHVDETAYNLHSAVWMEYHWKHGQWPRQEIISYGALPSFTFVAVRNLVMGGARADHWLAHTPDHQAYLHQGYTFDPRNTRAYYWPRLTALMRLVSALLYTLAVALTWRVGARLYGRWCGALAAVVAAGAAGMVQHAHYYTPEAFISVGSIALLHACLRIADNNRARDYAYAALAMVLIAASKVTSAPVCAFVVVAAYAHRRERRREPRIAALARTFDQGRLWAAVVLSVACWFWINRDAFRSLHWYFSEDTPYSPLQQVSAYRWSARLPDWALFYTNKPRHYFATRVLADALGRPLQLAALAGAAWVLLGERAARRWPALFALVILAPLLLTHLQTIRYLVPSLPFLALCAARLGQRALALARAPRPGALRVAGAAGAVLVGLAIAHGVAFGAAHTRMYLDTDNRIAAANWLRAHMRPRDWVVIEDHGFYSPTLGGECGFDPRVRPVDYGRLWVGGEDPASVANWMRGARYLVLNGWHMRLVDVPEARRLHPGMTAFYDQVRRRGAPPGFRLVATFANGPHLFGWRPDESRSEILHVAFDHVPLYVYERIPDAPPPPPAH